MLYKNLPDCVRQSALFCCWQYEDGTKRPINPVTGRYAASNDPSTFADFLTAVRAADRYSGIGVGIFDRLCAVDIDHCYSAIDGMTDYARDIVDTMRSYTEISPSGTGIRILFYADPATFDVLKYYVHNRKLGLEVYVAGATNKYVTVTGDWIQGEIGDRDGELRQVLDKYMQRPATDSSEPVEGHSLLSDEAVKDKAMRLYKFADLWNGGLGDSPSASEADLAFCVSLAFWTGRDRDQMDRLFRESRRMRDKWDAMRGAKTYGDMTLDKALSMQTTVYSPLKADAQPELVDEQTRMETQFHPLDNPRYGWTEIGAANLFTDWFEGLIAYVPEKKRWFTYDGTAWRAGNGEDIEAMSLLTHLADVLLTHARILVSLAPEPEDAKTKRPEDLFLAFAQKWQTRRFRENILKDARGNALVPIAQFDADPYQLNLRNGTLNLKSRTFREHNASDYHTMVADVDYDPTARSPRWESFVSEVMRGDAECGGFIQRALGYSLTGDISAECMFMLFGATTRNGKSTLAGTFARMMGDYAKNCSPETIAQKRGGNGGGGPSEDIARLRGARFVSVSEPDRRMALSTALIKSMTGGNELTARSLNECSFQFRPNFKIFIDTNYLPTSTDTTLFDSGRVHVIPFNRHFAEAEQDRGLKAELARPENLSGILNWCLEGYRLLCAEGGRFKQPEAVIGATAQYREDNDRTAAFLVDEMERDGDVDVLLTDAYSRYKYWCDARGYRTENLSSFKVGVEKTATVVKRRPRGNPGKGATSVIVGYKLKTGTDAAFQTENAGA